MVDHNTREMIEDVANLVALQVVRPIENRLTILETRICCKESAKNDTISLKWKVIGACLAFPGFVGAAISVFKIL